MQRTDRETWHRLLLWDKGQPQSERLAADVLDVEGFSSIDPMHPLGGRDSLKDLILQKNGHRWIAAVYFPSGEKSYAKIRKKFESDLQGVERNQANAFVFVTNQPISITKRAELEDIADKHPCEIYHLERLRGILDSLRCVAIRQRYLDILPSHADTLAAIGEVGELRSLVGAAAALSLPTQRRETATLRLPDASELSSDDLARIAQEQGQYDLHRGYVVTRDLLSALSNPEHPVEPIISVETFPANLAKCHRLIHEAAMLTLLLHRCIGLQYTDRLNHEERERLSSVVERLWRCAIRLRPVLDECQSSLLMIGSNRLWAPCAHLGVHICATSLLQEILQASDQTGYTSGAQALNQGKDDDALPYDPAKIVTNWPAIVDLLSNNTTLHEGFWLLKEAFRDLSGEIVRAARYDLQLPIVPLWMCNRD